jgi:hypothetical protein
MNFKDSQYDREEEEMLEMFKLFSSRGCQCKCTLLQ